MLDLAAPVAFTLFAWWFGTGAILYLDGLPRPTHKVTMAGATLLAVLGLWGLVATAAQTTPASAYCAFACAILVWAWQEVAFLLGYVTGPRRSACPPGARGWQRARFAAEAILHHELALVALGACIAFATLGQPNRTGLWTFLALWAMRQSAKINVFLGVRNLAEDFLPAHLAYLSTYFRRAAGNWFWPLATALVLVVTVALCRQVAAAPAGSFDYTAKALLATLLALGVVEHVFLVAPVPFDRLWRWGLRTHA